MIEFAWPWVWLLLPLPLLARWLLPATESSDRGGLRVPIYAELKALSPGSGQPGQLSILRLLLASLIWLLLVLAAARPQWVGEPVSLPVSGRDLMMAVDVSGSMEQVDMQLHGRRANRLQVVVDVGRQFIQAREGDRIGLIVFGTRAYMQTPLTFDRDTVIYMLDNAIPKMAGEKTAIGDAIGLAVKRLLESKSPHRVLILLSDGANTAGELDPRQAAKLAAAEGLRIYTVGIGADAMRVHGFLGTRTVNPSADLDEAMLRDVAETTGGRYFRARDADGLKAIYQQLDALEPVQRDEQLFRPLRALYMWPAGVAAGLALLWALVPWLQSLWRRWRITGVLKEAHKDA